MSTPWMRAALDAVDHRLGEPDHAQPRAREAVAVPARVVLRRQEAVESAKAGARSGTTESLWEVHVVFALLGCAGTDGGSEASQDPPSDDLVTATISSTDNNGCGIEENGTVTCWGSEERDVLEVPEGTFTSLTGGQDYACALDESSRVVCWGNPTDWGQLASGLPDDPFGLLEIPDGEFVQVDGGDTHICALEADGDVQCWGNEDDGRTSPPKGIQFKWVSAGFRTTLAVDVDGLIHVWGDNYVGDERPKGRYTQVSAGWDYGCGLKEDTEIRCWNVTYEPGPPTGTGWNWISVGMWHGCATNESGDIECWGRESWGEVGLKAGPSPPPSNHYEQVSADRWTTCARTRKGKFECWGNDYSGQTSPP